MDLGILNNPVLTGMFRRQEQKLYSISDSIGCMSFGNIDYVKRQNPEIDIKKLHLLPNWKWVIEYSPPDLSLKKQMGLENKFIALYGGNFGKPQKAEFILELARKMSVHEDVIFLFIGEGSEKQKIVELASEFELKNVLFKDQLPRHQYNEVVKVCDIGLVNLSDKFTIPNIPSRTLSYWEAKIPVLAAIDSNTDFNRILADSKSGLWIITGDLESYVKNFEKLYSDKKLREEMGENGHRYLLEYCTVSRACSIITEKLLS
jgi:glycosyltransferase involved in cell wall biosynthesis